MRGVVVTGGLPVKGQTATQTKNALPHAAAVRRAFQTHPHVPATTPPLLKVQGRHKNNSRPYDIIPVHVADRPHKVRASSESGTRVGQPLAHLVLAGRGCPTHTGVREPLTGEHGIHKVVLCHMQQAALYKMQTHTTTTHDICIPHRRNIMRQCRPVGQKKRGSVGPLPIAKERGAQMAVQRPRLRRTLTRTRVHADVQHVPGPQRLTCAGLMRAKKPNRRQQHLHGARGVRRWRGTKSARSKTQRPRHRQQRRPGGERATPSLPIAPVETLRPRCDTHCGHTARSRITRD